MGRWKRGKKLNKGNQNEPKRQKLQGQPGKWTKVIKENEAFVAFYQNQGFVPAEEWEEFMETLKRDLPSTFRITGTKGDAYDLAIRFKSLVAKMESNDDEEIRGNAPSPIPWYPDQIAWETKAAKKTLRKNPLYEDFHNFLVEETDCGAISRQEAVSMIPPLLLDVKSHHNVLDMCAAPGSKTTQLIEMMQENATNGMPSGILIANDADNKRCYKLAHQSKRLTTPGCIIANHDARVFPSLQVKEALTEKPVTLKFDRILCDVPCSGDGTLRKNIVLWRKWKPGLGYPLHRMQLQILHRGLELLKDGGRLVYSTCSMNPVENEAVIAAMLKRCQGAVRLVDTSGSLPELKRRPGLLSWKVASKSGQVFESYEKVAHSPVNYYRETMFCPSLEDAKDMHLNRCIRVLPHQQDTGAFFIAVLEKISKLPWQSSQESEIEQEEKAEFAVEPLDPLLDSVDDNEEINEQNQEDPGEEPKTTQTAEDEIREDAEDKWDETTEPLNLNKSSEETKHDKILKEKPWGYKEDPYIFLTQDDEDVVRIRKHFDVAPSFPADQLLVRKSEGKRRHIYVVTKAVKYVVDMNRNKLKVINTGIKAFSRLGLKVSQEIGCDFRLTQEGLHVMKNFINAKIVKVSREDLQLLLTEEEPFTTRLNDQSKETVNKCSAGCVVWHYLPETREPNDKNLLHVSSPLWLCGHKGKASVRCMLSKAERMHYMRIVGVSKPQNGTKSLNHTESTVNSDTADINEPSKETLENVEVEGECTEKSLNDKAALNVVE